MGPFFLSARGWIKLLRNQLLFGCRVHDGRLLRQSSPGVSLCAKSRRQPTAEIKLAAQTPVGVQLSMPCLSAGPRTRPKLLVIHGFPMTLLVCDHTSLPLPPNNRGVGPTGGNRALQPPLPGYLGAASTVVTDLCLEKRRCQVTRTIFCLDPAHLFRYCQGKGQPQAVEGFNGSVSAICFGGRRQLNGEQPSPQGAIKFLTAKKRPCAN